MSFRITTTVVISFVFITLMTTGILLYAIPWNYFIGAMHIWASLFFIIGTGLHFKNNLRAYLSYLKNKSGKRALACSATALVIVVGGLILGAAPFSTIMEVSEKLKNPTGPSAATYTLIDLSAGNHQPKLKVFIKAGSAYESEPQPAFMGFTYTTVPQLVVWMETMEGEYIDTLYVTGKTSSSGFGRDEQGAIRRPEALPRWSHRRGIREADGYFAPHENKADLDGLSGATPKSDYLISLSTPHMGRYRLLVEVNRSYDFNEYYSKNRFPDDPIYSGDGSSGQPSLIYEAIVEQGEAGQHLLNLIGHGHHSGADGGLYADLTQLSTAKDILSFIVATVE